MALTADQVQKFYIGYYARPADPVGLTYWQTQDEAAALKGFSESAEFTSQFTGLSASQQVTQVYNNLLGRAPDTAGLLYWSGELTAGRETIGTLVLSMTKNALGKDVTTIEDRVSYSKSFTAALDTPAEINAYAGAAATQAARTALLKVVANSVGDHTALDAEVKNIDATVAAIVAGGGAAPAQTFTLTTGVDFADVSGSYRNSSPTPFDFKFTSANETVSATELTLSAGDSLSDGSTADNDVLNLVLGAGGPAAPAAISNIETINLKTSGVTAAAGFVNLAGVTGAKVLNVSGPSGAPIVITGAGVGGSLDGSGITTIDASGVTSAVNGVTAFFTAATTAALKFTGSNAADVFVGGNGADTINGNAGDDFLVGGAGADTIDGGAGIDNILGGTNNDTINGGDGNDIIDGDLGNDVINGGAGNDIINGGAGQGGADKITGGAGNDAITLTAGAGNSETVIFEATGNGVDTITGLAGGAVAAGGDVLDFKAFLGGAASFAGAILGATITPPGVGYSTAVGENVVVIDDTVAGAGGIAGADGILTAAELAATNLTLGANAKVVIIYDNGLSVAVPGGLDQTAYYVTTDVNGAIAAVAQVGVFEGSSGLVYTGAQFA